VAALLRIETILRFSLAEREDIQTVLLRGDTAEGARRSYFPLRHLAFFVSIYPLRKYEWMFSAFKTGWAVSRHSHHLAQHDAHLATMAGNHHLRLAIGKNLIAARRGKNQTKSKSRPCLV
jgi:hypothetical protein